MYKITINNNIDINTDNSIIIDNFKKWLKNGVIVFEMETEEGTYYINKDNVVTVRISECIQVTKTIINESFPKELETPGVNDVIIHGTITNDNFDKELSNAICENIPDKE